MLSIGLLRAEPNPAVCLFCLLASTCYVCRCRQGNIATSMGPYSTSCPSPFGHKPYTGVTTSLWGAAGYSVTFFWVCLPLQGAFASCLLSDSQVPRTFSSRGSVSILYDDCTQYLVALNDYGVTNLLFVAGALCHWLVVLDKRV